MHYQVVKSKTSQEYVPTEVCKRKKKSTSEGDCQNCQAIWKILRENYIWMLRNQKPVLKKQKNPITLNHLCFYMSHI